jgi:hypothetical protein
MPHRLFHIPELLCLICVQLEGEQDKRLLYALAQANRAFSLASLPSLWANLPSVIPLMKLVCHDDELWQAMEDYEEDTVSTV